MAIEVQNHEKLDRVLNRDPNVTIFLRPIAPPAALGLAGSAGSTWITATYIAGWWGDLSSPTIFFPFVMLWGGLGQFIAGLFGYHARGTLVTVVNVLWGSLWLSFGLSQLLTVSLINPLTEWTDGRMLTVYRIGSRSRASPSTLNTFPRDSIVVCGPRILHVVLCVSPFHAASLYQLNRT